LKLSIAAECLAILLCMWEILGSALGPEIS